jgi:hypothetical protein
LQEALRSRAREKRQSTRKLAVSEQHGRSFQCAKA